MVDFETGEAEEVAGAGCSMSAEECHTEQKWLRRCSSGGPGFFPPSPPHRRRKKAKSPDSSLAHPLNAWGWGSCPKPDLHSLHHPRMGAGVVVEVVRETVSVVLLIYRVKFHHCQVPFPVRCPSLDVSFPFSGNPGMKQQNQPWTQSPSHPPFPPAPRHPLLHPSSGFSV